MRAFVGQGTHLAFILSEDRAMGSIDRPHPTPRLPGLHSRFQQLSPEERWLRVALNLCKLNTFKTGPASVTLA